MLSDLKENANEALYLALKTSIQSFWMQILMYTET